jgi:hypothetical protein
MTLEALGIGITVRMVTYLRLVSVVCRWKPLNAHNVVLWLVVMIIGLLVVSDLRRTWSVNSVDLEFDLDREGVLRWAAEKRWFLECTLVGLWETEFNFRKNPVKSFLISTWALEASLQNHKLLFRDVMLLRGYHNSNEHWVLIHVTLLFVDRCHF